MSCDNCTCEEPKEHEPIHEDLGSEYDLLPPMTRWHIDQYVEERRPGGHFITAVLENNLKEAVGHGDLANQRGLVAIVKYLYNHCPMNCWGSVEAVDAWLGREPEEREES